MIRALSLEEVPRFCQLAKMFFEEAGRGANYDWLGLANWWAGLLKGDIGVIFVYEDDGLIRGFISGYTCCEPENGRRVAVENHWYVLEQYRGKGPYLLKAFEKWAKSKGCTYLEASCMVRDAASDERPELQNMYKRMGYQTIRIGYGKEI